MTHNLIINKMKAGQTEINVNTKVEIKGITGEDSDLNGLTGMATHPFAFGCTDKGWVGIYLDQKGIYADDKVNVNSKNVVILPE